MSLGAATSSPIKAVYGAVWGNRTGWQRAGICAGVATGGVLYAYAIPAGGAWAAGAQAVSSTCAGLATVCSDMGSLFRKAHGPNGTSISYEQDWDFSYRCSGPGAEDAFSFPQNVVAGTIGLALPVIYTVGRPLKAGAAKAAGTVWGMATRTYGSLKKTVRELRGQQPEPEEAEEVVVAEAKFTPRPRVGSLVVEEGKVEAKLARRGSRSGSLSGRPVRRHSTLKLKRASTLTAPILVVIDEAEVERIAAKQREIEHRQFEQMVADAKREGRGVPEPLTPAEEQEAHEKRREAARVQLRMQAGMRMAETPAEQAKKLTASELLFRAKEYYPNLERANDGGRLLAPQYQKDEKGADVLDKQRRPIPTGEDKGIWECYAKPFYDRAEVLRATSEEAEIVYRLYRPWAEGIRLGKSGDELTEHLLQDKDHEALLIEMGLRDAPLVPLPSYRQRIYNAVWSHRGWVYKASMIAGAAAGLTIAFSFDKHGGADGLTMPVVQGACDAVSTVFYNGTDWINSSHMPIDISCGTAAEARKVMALLGATGIAITWLAGRPLAAGLLDVFKEIGKMISEIPGCLKSKCKQNNAPEGYVPLPDSTPVSTPAPAPITTPLTSVVGFSPALVASTTSTSSSTTSGSIGDSKDEAAVVVFNMVVAARLAQELQEASDNQDNDSQAFDDKWEECQTILANYQQLYAEDSNIQRAYDLLQQKMTQLSGSEQTIEATPASTEHVAAPSIV